MHDISENREEEFMNKTWKRERELANPPLSFQEVREEVVVRVRLRPLFRDEVLTIGEADGSKTIFRAVDVFKHISPGFEELDVPSPRTLATEVAMFETLSSGTPTEAFGSIGALDWVLLTQHQIVLFCKNYGSHLAPVGRPASFLFQQGEELFSASVCVREGGEKEVIPFALKHGVVWSATDKRRIVVPGILVHLR